MLTFRIGGLLLLSSFLLPAQDPTSTVAVKAVRPAGAVVTASFRGGTMADFVAVVRSAEPKANIVVATAAAAAKVPPMEVRGAGLDQLLSGACAVAEAEFLVRVNEFRGEGEPVYSIVAMLPQGAPGPQGAQVQTVPSKPDESTSVFSLNRLTEPDPRLGGGAGLRAETILSAIEAGGGDDPKQPGLRYHRESGLLFVRGNRTQIALVKDLLTNLERDLEERRRRAAPAKAPPAVDENAPKDAPKKGLDAK